METVLAYPRYNDAKERKRRSPIPTKYIVVGAQENHVECTLYDILGEYVIASRNEDGVLLLVYREELDDDPDVDEVLAGDEDYFKD